MTNNTTSYNNTSLVNINYISENAVLLEWPEKICATQHQHIMFCQEQICSALADNVIDCIVSYASLLIYYKFELISYYALNTLLHNIVQMPYSPNDVNAMNNNTQNVVEIPVYYSEESGWDLANVTQQTELSIEDVIKLHTQTSYRAYALGFTPGFCYLGELPTQLQIPRKASPRLSVPKGAVAIAEQQTAIYPNTSPGGWHIIGQTPLDMYSVHMPLIESHSKDKKQFETKINVGQSVKFFAITQAEFLSLGGTLIQEQP